MRIDTTAIPHLVIPRTQSLIFFHNFTTQTTRALEHVRAYEYGIYMPGNCTKSFFRKLQCNHWHMTRAPSISRFVFYSLVPSARPTFDWSCESRRIAQLARGLKPDWCVCVGVHARGETKERVLNARNIAPIVMCVGIRVPIAIEYREPVRQARARRFRVIASGVLLSLRLAI